jgi:hypothetical protein
MKKKQKELIAKILVGVLVLALIAPLVIGYF